MAPARLPRRRPLLTYHELVARDCKYLYSSSCDQLRWHLQVLRECFGAPGAGSSLPVSFDDGHASHYRYALPLLEEFSQKAIFFALAGYMGGRPQSMTWPQLRELVSLGHQVQSHGWSHIPLTHCDDETLRAELTKSKATLEDKLAHPVDSISIPFGRWNRKVLDACACAGYTHVYISNPFLTSTARRGVVLHGRLMVQRNFDAADLRRFLAAGSASWLTMRAKTQTKRIARSLVGDRLYHALWCKLAAGEASADIHDEYRGAQPAGNSVTGEGGPRA